MRNGVVRTGFGLTCTAWIQIGQVHSEERHATYPLRRLRHKKDRTPVRRWIGITRRFILLQKSIDCDCKDILRFVQHTAFQCPEID
jgi:hypothetical protein